MYIGKGPNIYLTGSKRISKKAIVLALLGGGALVENFTRLLDRDSYLPAKMKSFAISA